MDDFKETFKYFKHKRSDSGQLRGVVDFESQNTWDHYANPFVKESVDCNEYDSICSLCSDLGLTPHRHWRAFEIKNRPGLFFIRNPFTREGQRRWIRKCLESYPRKPSVTSLDLHHESIPDDVWSLRNSSDPTKRHLVAKLAWTTFGYHHNWDTKVYDPTNRSPFPECLAELTKHLALYFGCRTLKPEAAIVNYYSGKSSLGIHNDHSEVELDQPIVSVSFGQSAIFLVGSEVRAEKPLATYLRSGDVVILSGASRLAYHAVPAIVEDSTIVDRYSCSTSNLHDDETWKPFREYIQKHRINISVRQVYPDVAISK